MKLTESNSVNLAKPLAESAVASPLNGIVPTVEQVEDVVGMGSNAWDCVPPVALIEAVLWCAGMQPPNNQPNSVDLPLLTVLAKAITTIAHTTNHCSDEYTRLSETARLVMEEVLPQACKLLGTQCLVTMQHNQPNSVHVAVIGAKPDSVHLAEPAETATDPRLRGSHIQNSWSHNEGAYARCSYCRRYSDNPNAITKRRFMCDCGKDTGWCGSFEPPTAKSTWSGPESGISSPTYRPNEQNDVVQTEQPSLSDDLVTLKLDAADLIKRLCESRDYSREDAKRAVVHEAVRMIAKLGDALLAQRQDSDKDALVFSGYFDEDEYQGSTIEKFLKHRNESEGMHAWEIGHEFQVDAVYSRTEQWRVTNDVPWTAERIDCAAIANGAPK